MCEAIRRSRRALEYARAQRREAIKVATGSHYSEDASRKRQPVNFLALYISIVGRNLISKNPRVMLSVFERTHKPMVAAMQAWVNQQTERMKVMEAYQRIVVDALYSVGIAKVALATPADAATQAWGINAGEPFLLPVDLDDWFYSTVSTRFEEASFMGHFFRAPLDAVKDSRIYNKSRLKLEASVPRMYDETGNEKVRVIGSGANFLDEEFEDMVDLVEVYLPRHRLVLTMPADYIGQDDEGQTEPLREQGWIGPDSGPYHILGYGIVPGNALPKGPLQDLLDLNESGNVTFRKLQNQANRQKDLTFVAGAADADGKRTMDANDGDVIRNDHPDKIKQVSMGGPNALNQQFFLLVKTLFSWVSGNIEALGGLSPQAPTLGQDKMLQQSSSQQITDMQDRTVKFVSETSDALLWYFHHDPYKVQKSEHSIMPGVSIQRQVTPQDRTQLKFGDLLIKVDPYSLKHSTPQEKMGQLNQIVNQTIVPMMPLLQQAGVQFDVTVFLKKAAELLDLPELPEMVTISEPPMQPDGAPGAGAPPRMPTQTERTYTRESRPTRTEGGDMMNRMNALAGINPGGNPEASKNGAQH